MQILNLLINAFLERFQCLALPGKKYLYGTTFIFKKIKKSEIKIFQLNS